MNYWEHFYHEADIGIRGCGDDRTSAYAEVAKALTAVVTDLQSVQALNCIEITVNAPDDEFLLVDWINALIYEMSVQKMLFSQFELTMQGHGINAKVCGEPVNIRRHQPAVEIKGATFTELSVRQDPNGTWCAQCVVDV